MNMPLQTKCKFRTRHLKDNHAFPFYYYILSTHITKVSNTTQSLLRQHPQRDQAAETEGSFVLKVGELFKIEFLDLKLPKNQF